MVEGRGSTGNVLAAICSLIIPGVGQLVQGRLITAGVHFVAAVVLHAVSFGTLGWIVHVWSSFSAAIFKPR